MQWTQEATNAAGIVERGFTVKRDGHIIPGVVWSPSAQPGPQPLVLMGHRGSGHKRNERMLMLGRLFSRDYGWCAASIDGPVHGERGPVTDANDPAYRQMWQRQESVELFDRLGSPDKRLHAYPGQHADNGPEAFDVQAEFFKRYLS